jgi:hypothetical protein
VRYGVYGLVSRGAIPSNFLIHVKNEKQSGGECKIEAIASLTRADVGSGVGGGSRHAGAREIYKQILGKYTNKMIASRDV